jgi:hypothetical protein
LFIEREWSAQCSDYIVTALIGIYGMDLLVEQLSSMNSVLEVFVTELVLPGVKALFGPTINSVSVQDLAALDALMLMLDIHVPLV